LNNTHDIIGLLMKKEDTFVGIVRIETVRIDNVPVTLKVGFSVRSSSKAVVPAPMPLAISSRRSAGHCSI
jgi:hypothetical protein